jgi:fatty-acid desaturase
MNDLELIEHWRLRTALTSHAVAIAVCLLLMLVALLAAAVTDARWFVLCAGLFYVAAATAGVSVQRFRRINKRLDELEDLIP